MHSILKFWQVDAKGSGSGELLRMIRISAIETLVHTEHRRNQQS